MTVAATDRKAGPFTNNTSAPIVGPFAFTFKIFALTDVKVVRTTTTEAIRATETLAYGTDYTVSANLTTQDSSPGGSITLTGDVVAGTGSLLQPGYHLTILSSVAYSQLTALTNYDRFNPTTLNEVHDRAVALTQQLKEQNERTLTVPATSTMDPADFLEEVFEARDTAVTKAAEAAASAAYAAEKVDGFDVHVAQKTTEFDVHAASKTSEFDANASTKTTAFNSNASTKTTTFDANASAKTSAFDSHVTQKTNLFDGHVIDQTSRLDLHVARTAASITGVADESRLNVSKAKTWAEGVDSTLITTNTGLVIATSNTVDLATRTELEILGGTHSSKGWAQLSESAKTAAESAQSSAESASTTATTKASEAAASATSAATTVSGFDSHASEKQTDFDTNATSKTSAFNSNASTKTSTFDSNASSKTTAFDTNATTKTSAFDSNASSKTTDFNTNAATKKAEVDALVDQAEEFADQAEEFSDKAEVWAEGTDAEVSALGGEHSAKRWAEISIVAQSDWTESQSGSTSYIRHKPVIDTETSSSSTNAVTNAAVTARINEIWSWIYNQSGWSPILATTSGVDLMSSTNEVILADHA